MSFLSCTNRKKKHQKFQLVQLFRQQKKPSNKHCSELQFIDKFAEQLSKQIASYKRIQTLSWKGIPACIRPKIWKFLLKYVLINDAETILLKKRGQYKQLLKNYWKPDSFSQDQKKIFHTINVDVKRIGSDFIALCKNEAIQQMLKRLLFIWHNRHPASGYVQGMCDVSMPFLIVFLSQYLPYFPQEVRFCPEPTSLSAQTLQGIEADMYWCMSKLMESVTTNYTQGFDGLKQAYNKVQEFLYRIDGQLLEHFRKQKIDFFSVSFRNISTMLLRMFNPNVAIRLFDTYIACEGSFPDLMVFIFIAIIEKFAHKLLEMRFQQLMAFLQSLPTRRWDEADLEMVIAQAYCYQAIFAEKQ